MTAKVSCSGQKGRIERVEARGRWLFHTCGYLEDTLKDTLKGTLEGTLEVTFTRFT